MTSYVDLEDKFLRDDSPRITLNSVRCLDCKDVIVSTHCHDYVTCSCGHISVDGGHEYLRRVGKLDHYEELSTHEART